MGTSCPKDRRNAIFPDDTEMPAGYSIKGVFAWRANAKLSRWPMIRVSSREDDTTGAAPVRFKRTQIARYLRGAPRVPWTPSRGSSQRASGLKETDCWAAHCRLSKLLSRERDGADYACSNRHLESIRWQPRR